MSLIDTWLEAGKASGMKTNWEVLQDLNEKTGLDVRQNRMYEWRLGTHRPPIEATNYMLSVSLNYAFKKIRPRTKFTNDELRYLLNSLSLPE